MGWCGKLAVGAFVLAACVPSTSAPPPDGSAPTSSVSVTSAPSTSDGPTTSTAPTTVTTPAVSGPVECRRGVAPVAVAAWQDGPSAELQVLQETGPRVSAVRYPLPDAPFRLWSQWGKGVALGDGRFLSALGDERGADGNSYVYEFDPGSGRLSLVFDVMSVVDHTPGAWGYGKIHAPMLLTPCGDVYTATYWGTRRGLVFGDGYDGDLLLRIDPDARTVENLGVVASGRGVPSMALGLDGRTLFAEAVEPVSDTGVLVTVDLATGERSKVTIPGHQTFRSVLVGPDGIPRVAVGDGELAAVGPDGAVVREGGLPGAVLRMATPPGPDGSVVGVTVDPDVFFRRDPDGSIVALAPALGYTTSLARSDDGATVYSIPRAHGSAWTVGAPLMALDVATGRLETVVELGPLLEREMGLRLGGTYSIVADGSRLFVGVNASTLDDDSGFGVVALVVVDLDR